MNPRWAARGSPARPRLTGRARRPALVTSPARPPGRSDVAANGLAVDLGEAGDRLVAVPPDPQPEHLLDLHHIHLPEHHAATPARGFRRRVPVVRLRSVDFREGVP